MSTLSLLVRFATVLVLILGAHGPAQAQVGTALRVPELIASNDCDDSRPCVRQMLQLKQFAPRQQSQLLYLLGLLPAQPAGSGASTSCSSHSHGGGHATIVCLDIRAEGSCACVLTTTGSHCVGTNPYCPVTLH